MLRLRAGGGEFEFSRMVVDDWAVRVNRSVSDEDPTRTCDADCELAFVRLSDEGGAGVILEEVEHHRRRHPHPAAQQSMQLLYG